jgi:hypothetical protein
MVRGAGEHEADGNGTLVKGYSGPGGEAVRDDATQAAEVVDVARERGAHRSRT